MVFSPRDGRGRSSSCIQQKAKEKAVTGRLSHDQFTKGIAPAVPFHYAFTNVHADVLYFALTITEISKGGTESCPAEQSSKDSKHT